MGGACGMHGEELDIDDRVALKCNVTGLVGMDWIYLAQDMDKWWVL
jgi:hypothetical protein